MRDGEGDSEEEKKTKKTKNMTKDQPSVQYKKNYENILTSS